ncbi:hypothetical protein EV122DRAFT_255470 [Schizophyllum commune]
MKFPIVLGSLVALASASAIQTREDYPDCGPNIGFYVPETVTRGQAFPVRFCSDTYAKPSSQSITLALNPLSKKSVDGAVILTDELASDNGKKYDFEATVPESLDLTSNTFLAVVEKINDHYVSTSQGIQGACVTVVASRG